MPIALGNFYFDSAGLPRRLAPAFELAVGDAGRAQAAFVAAVTNILANNLQVPPPLHQVVVPAVIGLLLLDEKADENAFGFADTVARLYLTELLPEAPVQPGWVPPAVAAVAGGAAAVVPFRATRIDVHQAISDRLEVVRGVRGQAAYQEFATVGRFVVSRLDAVPLGHPNFDTQVDVGVNNYVAGDKGFDALDLPPLAGDDGADVEIEPDNVRAFGTVLAAYHLEQLRLFDVVDRVSESFTNGLLPIGLDDGGRRLDDYYWTTDQRLNKAGRMMHFSRMTGATGGEVSREVQPNREFFVLWDRFLAAVSEFDRQDRVSDLLNPLGRRPVSQTGENVRKAGRDLAANVTLYGYASAHFAARRLRAHITEALDILKAPSVLRAHGVTSPWQVVERVAAQDFGAAPNVVRFRTLADASKQILDIIASHAAVFTSTSGGPLYAPVAAVAVAAPAMAAPPARRPAAQLPYEVWQRLVRLTEQIQAVTGTSDQRIAELSQPGDTPPTPSVPAFPNRLAGGNNTLAQLQQMVSSGQTPSLDQLRSLLPT